MLILCEREGLVVILDSRRSKQKEKEKEEEEGWDEGQMERKLKRMVQSQRM